MNAPNIANNDTSTAMPWERMLERAGAAVGQDGAAVRGRSRLREICRARWAAILVLRESGLSYPRIGKRLGGRDHSTIIHAEREGLKLLATCPEFVALVAELRGLMAGEAPPPLRLPNESGLVCLRPRRLPGLRSFDCDEREEEEHRRMLTRGSLALLSALAALRAADYNVVIPRHALSTSLDRCSGRAEV